MGESTLSTLSTTTTLFLLSIITITSCTASVRLRLRLTPSWFTTLVLAMWLMFLLSIMWLESMLIPITTITSCTASVRLRLNLRPTLTDPPWSWPCYPPCPPCPHCPCWCQHSSLPLQLHVRQA